MIHPSQFFKKTSHHSLIVLCLFMMSGCGDKQAPKKTAADPSSDGSYLQQAVALDHQGNLDDTLQILNKAIQINPNDAKAYGARGDIYVKKHEFDEAMEDFNKSITLDSNFAAAYAARGLIETGVKNQVDQGLEDFNKAIGLNPN